MNLQVTGKDINNIDNQIAQLTQLRQRTLDIYNKKVYVFNTNR